jgi:hypothetical protein
MTDFSDVLAPWSTKEKRRELRVGIGATPSAVHDMFRYKNIPSHYWRKFVRLARESGQRGITLELLARLDEGRKARLAAARAKEA